VNVWAKIMAVYFNSHKKYFYLIFLLYQVSCFRAQTKEFLWPLDPPILATGNYGELRPNHFHAGIDLSTNGRVNLPVYTVAEGYVSRIRVSPYGYGKSVYITHPNGNVTVYAHLNSFSLKLDKMVKKEMKALQKYEIDHYPLPYTTLVRRGEIIGLSGNTGGSSGPHLHFEIRDAKSEVPLNPLNYLKIEDRIHPALTHVAFFDLADTSAPKVVRKSTLRKIENDSVGFDKKYIVLPHSIIGIAFSGSDKFSASGSTNNIYSAKIFLDGKLIYAHTLDNISFDDSRYVNEFSEVIDGVKYQKCFLPTLYPVKMYPTSYGKGRIMLADTLFHGLKLVVADEAGNTTTSMVFIKCSKFNFYRTISQKGDFVSCVKDQLVNQNGMRLFIPAKTLYSSTSVTLINNLDHKSTFEILPEKTNLNASVKIGFKIPTHLIDDANKLVARNRNNVVPSLIRNDSVFFDLKQFGKYEILLDKEAPLVKVVLPVKKDPTIWNSKSLSFFISDKLSGIGKFNLYLNNQWVLADYDAKTNLVVFYIDENTKDEMLHFKLEVADKVGNKTTYFYMLKN